MISALKTRAQGRLRDSIEQSARDIPLGARFHERMDGVKYETNKTPGFLVCSEIGPFQDHYRVYVELTGEGICQESDQPLYVDYRQIVDRKRNKDIFFDDRIDQITLVQMAQLAFDLSNFSRRVS